MKVGDLVRHAPTYSTPLVGVRVGLVVDLIQKKCWRTMEKGKKVDWNAIDPEPHAVVLYPHNAGTINIPVVELEVVDESR